MVEADEFDRSFLALHPKMAVITSMDADHLDIYGEKEALENSFQDFANQIDQNGLLLIHKSIVENIEFGGLTRSYSADDVEADIHAENMHIKDGAYHFDIRYPKGKIADITFHFPGKHNVENACAAVGIALEQGVSEEEIRTALLSFKGVVRRFQTHVSGKNRIYIDDYAHHPAELTATINSARALYPNKRLCGIFQPHLFSRTQDFADEFALALDLLDEIILLPIYPAREEPIPGVDSQLILDKMKSESKKTVQKNELLYELKQVEAEVILTLGAGDIDQFVEPIAKALNK